MGELTLWRSACNHDVVMLAEDDLEHAEKEIQIKTDEYIKEIDTGLTHKEKDILAI